MVNTTDIHILVSDIKDKKLFVLNSKTVNL